MRVVVVVIAVVLSALAASCGGSSTGSGTPTPAPVSGVQDQALQALTRVTSGVVNVTGHASQGSDAVDFTIEYRTDAGRFAYHAASTHNGAQSDVQVIGVPPQTWTLENGAWSALPAGLPVDSFRARRIWSLAPFPNARPIGMEQVAGIATTHYRYDGPASLAFGELAGSLVASSDINFTGELRHLTVNYWIANDGGFPVKASYNASGDGNLKVTVELSHLNDTTVVVQAPR